MKSDGRVLRNALLWMDVRATDQARRIFSSKHEALRYSLAGVSAEWMPAKALWLKENEPNLYHETDYLIEYADWIAFKLTGKISLNLNTITQRWYYHTPTGGWPTDFYAKIGLADLEVSSRRQSYALESWQAASALWRHSCLVYPQGFPSLQVEEMPSSLCWA